MVLSILTIALLHIVIQLPGPDGRRKAVLSTLAYVHLFTISADELLSLIGTILRVPALGIVILFALVIPSKSSPKNSLYRAYLFFIILFIAWGAASLLWSVDLFDTMTKSLIFALMATFIHLFFKRRWSQDFKTVVEDIKVFSTTVTVFLIISAMLTFPALLEAFGGGNRYQGILQNPNTVGALAAAFFYASILVCINQRHKLLWVAPMLLLGFLYLAGSRSSTMALILAGIVVGSIQLISSPNLLTRLVPVVSYVGLITVAGILWVIARRPLISEEGISSLVPRQFNIELDSTSLNGRDVLWEAGFGLHQEKPLVGYGFNGTRTALEMLHTRGLFVGEARQLHNSYLEVLLDLGVIGFIIFLILLFILLYQATRTTQTTATLGAILLTLLILSMTESSLFGLSSIVAIMFWMTASMVFAAPRKNSSTASRKLATKDLL